LVPKQLIRGSGTSYNASESFEKFEKPLNYPSCEKISQKLSPSGLI